MVHVPDVTLLIHILIHYLVNATIQTSPSTLQKYSNLS